jgi:hypothetical protein
MFDLFRIKDIPERQPEDHLSATPPEILLMILSQIPLTSYFDLCHTSRFLKIRVQSKTHEGKPMRHSEKSPAELQLTKVGRP